MQQANNDYFLNIALSNRHDNIHPAITEINKKIRIPTILISILLPHPAESRSDFWQWVSNPKEGRSRYRVFIENETMKLTIQVRPRTILIIIFRSIFHITVTLKSVAPQCHLNVNKVTIINCLSKEIIVPKRVTPLGVICYKPNQIASELNVSMV